MSDAIKADDNLMAVGDEKKLKCIHQESVPRIVTIENIRVLGLDPADEQFYMSFSAEDRKRIKRKVGIRGAHRSPE